MPNKRLETGTTLVQWTFRKPVVNVSTSSARGVVAQCDHRPSRLRVMSLQLQRRFRNTFCETGEQAKAYLTEHLATTPTSNSTNGNDMSK